ncbi:g10934 [Coccomyxa viridis]|uniref:Protein CLP1 homolog n=1 Tax=Coccomyxa viridis TaxID=1274662 RepID=A0ABP1GDP4_9CHLO
MDSKVQAHTLAQGHELRIEVKPDKVLLLKLVQGEAEIFGTELALGEQLSLRGQKLAVFTWNGCTVELAAEDAQVDDVAESVYESDDTPMLSYLNVHESLEQRRRAAREAGTSGRTGPRTIVVGPTDVGKSSLCRILLNYAVRTGWAPTAVDLDIGQGSITVPGSIAATPVEGPIDVEEGMPIDLPLVFYYGHQTPTENPELYRAVVERMSSILDKRENVDVQAAGLIINTMGFIEGLGYELLLHAISALRADVVLVLGQERLFNQLKTHLRAQQRVSVVRLHSSGGVVSRTPPVRKQARMQRVKEYFYGVRGDLSPHSQTIRLDDLRIYRIGGGPRAPTSALPIGASSVADPIRVTPVSASLDLMHSMLAVSHAATPDQLLSVNVAGFVLITDVDIVQRTITYLAPCPGSLPGRYLIAGSFKVFLE